MTIMNNMKYLLLLVLSCMLLACSQEDAIIEQSIGKGEIDFVIGMVPQAKASTGADFKTTFEPGDAIGIFAVKRTDPSTVAAPAQADNYAHNYKYVRQQDGTWKSAEKIIYYPDDNMQLDFYAYYPYRADAADPTAIVFNVAADQSTKDGYAASDLMTARNTSATGQTPVLLRFSHKLSMVQVEVKSTDVDLNNLEYVNLTNCLPQVTLNLANTVAGELGAVSGVAEDIKMKRVVNSPAATYTYRAIIPAQQITDGNKLFYFKHPVYNYNYNAAGNIDLIGGVIKLFDVTL